MKAGWTLVTGASAGIGRELAIGLAERQFKLVLLARQRERLETLADELRARHGVETRVLAADLAEPEAPARVFEALRELRLEGLVNNAGLGLYGPFAQSDPAAGARLMRVNMTALVELTRRFVEPMLQRGSGRILNVASVAAFQPGPSVSLYYASKAFVYSFSYALAVELKGTGVTVTTLCPGSTRTEFFERAGMHMARPLGLSDPRRVARAGIDGMLRGKRVVIPGWKNRLIAALSPCLPPALPAAAVRKIHAPR